MKQIRTYLWILMMLIGMLGFPLVSSAHAQLTRSNPAAEAELSSAPSTIKLTYSEGIDANVSQASLQTEAGTTIKMKLSSDGEKTLVITPSAPLADGIYKVAWQVLSVDSHVTEGSFRFAVGVKLPTLRPHETISLDGDSGEANGAASSQALKSGSATSGAKASKAPSASVEQKAGAQQKVANASPSNATNAGGMSSESSEAAGRTQAQAASTGNGEQAGVGSGSANGAAKTRTTAGGADASLSQGTAAEAAAKGTVVSNPIAGGVGTPSTQGVASAGEAGAPSTQGAAGAGGAGTSSTQGAAVTGEAGTPSTQGAAVTGGLADGSSGSASGSAASGTSEGIAGAMNHDMSGMSMDDMAGMAGMDGMHTEGMDMDGMHMDGMDMHGMMHSSIDGAQVLRIVDVLLFAWLCGMWYFRNFLGRAMTGQRSLAGQWIGNRVLSISYAVAAVLFLASGASHLLMLASQLSMHGVFDQQTLTNARVLFRTTAIGAVVWLRPLLTLSIMVGFFLESVWPKGSRVVQCFLMLGLACTFPMTGHAWAAESMRGLIFFTDAIHLVMVAVWFGGLLGLCLVAWKLPKDANGLASIYQLVQRFSNVALPLIVIVVISGIWLALIRMSSWDILFHSSYGQTLLWKLGFFIVALLLAGLQRMQLLPRMRKQEQEGGAEALRWWRLCIRLELACAFIVFIVAGILSTSMPPAV